MDNNVNLVSSSVQELKKSSAKKRNTNTKASNNKKSSTKPVKVVYISNPMKVKTSASHFRALVQELTGRDSEFPHHDQAARFSTDWTAKIGGDLDADDGDDNHDDQAVVMSTPSTDNSESFSANSSAYNISANSPSSNSAANRFEALDDDVFMPQIMDGFSTILPSTSVWYESPHQFV